MIENCLLKFSVVGITGAKIVCTPLTKGQSGSYFTIFLDKCLGVYLCKTVFLVTVMGELLRMSISLSVITLSEVSLYILTSETFHGETHYADCN